jgi:hypothetical protein
MTETINRTEARRRWGKAYGSWYWADRHRNEPKGFAYGETKAERVAHILEMRKYRELMKTAPPETNERGNTIYRNEDAESFLRIRRGEERYFYDFEALPPAQGWKQFDTSQDAWYFGVWVNLEKRMTFTYAEGDRTLVVCPDDDHLRAELKDAVEFYGDPPPAFICFDPDGTRTDVYDTRPTLYTPEVVGG